MILVKRKNKAKPKKKSKIIGGILGIQGSVCRAGESGTDGADPPWGGDEGLSRKEPGFPQNGIELQKL